MGKANMAFVSEDGHDNDMVLNTLKAHNSSLMVAMFFLPTLIGRVEYFKVEFVRTPLKAVWYIKHICQSLWSLSFPRISDFGCH